MYLFVIRVHRDVSGVGVEIDEKYFWKRTHKYSCKSVKFSKYSISAFLASGVELIITILDRKNAESSIEWNNTVISHRYDFMFSPHLD